MSVAYAVISHRYLEQVLRLARTLRAVVRKVPLFIHHDDVAALAGLGASSVRPPTAVAWGWAS